MKNVRIAALDDILPRLPDIVTFDPKRGREPAEDEVFVCVLGFEPRCLSIPMSLKEAGYKAKRSVCVVYATNPDDNDLNRDLLEEQLRAFSDEVFPITENEPEFRRLFDEIIRGAGNEGKPITVTFDISVAASRLILKCMQALMESDVNLRIVYSEAETYHPTEEEYAAKKEACRSESTIGLDYGVSDVVFSMEYPGNHLDPMPDYVAVFPTFNKQRSWAAISCVDPSLTTNPQGKVSWLVGDPLHAWDKWRTEAMIEINELSSELDHRLVSTFDYKETIRALGAIHESIWEGGNLSVVPLGSKLQAVGISVFCYLHSDVRVLYSIPRLYNGVQYSTGCRAFWMLDLGAMPDLRDLLSQVGTLQLADSSVPLLR